jgi:hypothetical protein
MPSSNTLPVNNRSQLVLFPDEFNNKELIKILGNKAAGVSSVKEQELLMGIFSHALASEISGSLDMKLTPYFNQTVVNTDPEEKFATYNIFLLQGSNNFMTKYYGKSILNSEIETKLLPIWTKRNIIYAPIILSSKLTFFESRKEFSTIKTLFDIVKDISDSFAGAANLKLIEENRGRYKKNSLLYSRNKYSPSSD